MIEHPITLDVTKRVGSIPPCVTVRVGDVGSQVVVASLINGGEPYDPDADSARLDVLKADGTWCRCTAEVTGSVARCELPPQAVSSPGTARLAYFVFNSGDAAESTEGFELRVLGAVDPSAEEAKGYDDQLTKLYEKWLAYERQAEQQESARVSAEKARASAESARANAEQSRSDAEETRESNESTRKSNETARKSAETKRSNAEKARADAEALRDSAEHARSAAEQARTEAEDGRASAEQARESAEAQRAAAESEREQRQAKNDADQALNNEAARNSQPIWLGSGQYDPDTLAPTIENPIEGPLYFVPLSEDRVATMVATSRMGLSRMTLDSFESLEMAAASGNAYVEWLWHNSDSRWEQVGTSQKQVTPISTDDIDAVAGGGQKSGESVLTLTGLSYLWVKIKAAFAPIVHRHAISDIGGLQEALDGKAASSHAHAVATTASDGFMSKADKAKLNGIATGANKTVVDSAMSTTSTNPVQNKVVNAQLQSIRDSVSRTVTVGSGLAGSSVWCDTHLSQRVCLTARTADRARGNALVASDTSLLLYDLDAQKPIWDMRVQHPIYFSSVNSTSLTVTTQHDCVIEVEAWFERQWGYGGGEATLSILTPAGLKSMCAVTGRIYGGNTVGRSLHAFGAFSGAKEGKTYTFTCSLDGSGTGVNHGSMIARCFPA